MFKPILILMIGVCGSGKTTKAKELAIKYNATIISSDSIRAELYDINDQEHNNEVFDLLHKRVHELLKNDINVIVDATNITMKSRRGFMDYDATKVAYIMRTDYGICVARDLNRERTVGEHVIDAQIAKFQIPFYEEGFEYILFDDDNVISQSEDIYKDIDNSMKGFNQNNPNHKYDLYIHGCYCALSFGYDDIVKYYIARWHDFGKRYCEKKDENGISHYYNHANIGAWVLMTFRDWFGKTRTTFGDKDLLYILFMINYHMLPFSWKEEKTKNKYKKIFGEKLYNDLIEFNKCDKLASGTEGEDDEEI